MLTLCAAAVLGGMRSITAIAGWVADVPAEVLARLYARPALSPSKTTLWRVLTGADAVAVVLVDGTVCPTWDWSHVPDLFSAKVGYPGINLQVAATLDGVLLSGL